MASATTVDDFIPSCVVCRNPVPYERRSRETCSRECAMFWKQYQAYLSGKKRCPSCYHPSTPEERRDFHLWRIHRGDLHERRGRPRLTFEDRMRHVIHQQVIPALRSGDVNHLASLADELQKMLDSKGKS